MNFNHSLIMAREEEATLSEIGLEGFSGFADFLQHMTTVIGKGIDALLNKEFKGIDVYPVETTYLDKIFKSTATTFIDLQKENLYCPDNLNATMVDFVTTLAEQLNAYADIKDRLYDPMNVWLARVATMDGFETRIWKDRDLKLNDIERDQKAMQAYFKPHRESDTPGDLMICSDLFPSRKQFERTFELLSSASQAGTRFSLTDLKRAETKTVELINVILERESKEPSFEISSPNKKQLSSVLQAIAAETEYLVSLCYLGITAIVAWNDNKDRIEAAMEDLAEEK